MALYWSAISENPKSKILVHLVQPLRNSDWLYCRALENFLEKWDDELRFQNSDFQQQKAVVIFFALDQMIGCEKLINMVSLLVIFRQATHALLIKYSWQDPIFKWKHVWKLSVFSFCSVNAIGDLTEFHISCRNIFASKNYKGIFNRKASLRVRINLPLLLFPCVIPAHFRCWNSTVYQNSCHIHNSRKNLWQIR